MEVACHRGLFEVLFQHLTVSVKRRERLPGLADGGGGQDRGLRHVNDVEKPDAD